MKQLKKQTLEERTLVMIVINRIEKRKTFFSIPISTKYFVDLEFDDNLNPTGDDFPNKSVREVQYKQYKILRRNDKLKVKMYQKENKLYFSIEEALEECEKIGLEIKEHSFI